MELIHITETKSLITVTVERSTRYSIAVAGGECGGG